MSAASASPLSLPDTLASLAHHHHGSLPSSHHPQIRTDPSCTREWTPLAALFLFHPSQPLQPELISLGAGSKVVPTSKRKEGGKQVWDMHAEMLAVRGGRRFLLDEVGRATMGVEEEGLRERSRWIERGAKGEGRWRLREGVEMHLYISTLPCESFLLDGLRRLSRTDQSGRCPCSRSKERDST
jgi:hypothetical protein